MAASSGLRFETIVQPIAATSAARSAAREPHEVPAFRQTGNREDARDRDRNCGQNKRRQQTPHEAAQELFDDKPPPSSRNLLLKLIHDKVPKCRRENGRQLWNYTARRSRRHFR